ncbi:hypothetical protein PSENEW3n2_00005451 [Picochlorum sp. SENEW3]|nr:hypothetical protein PSENEW3n2_00005451 [Picochlorum sp. SENEW3]WPT17447.1 hypothetical protein PSENEW3_00005451 [Picochlorum sp. SENEW3]
MQCLVCGILLACSGLVAGSGFGEDVTAALGNSMILDSHGDSQMLEYEHRHRQLLQDPVLPSGNGRPPAWKARFDPRYEDAYLAPARIKNKCNTSKKNCTAIRGKMYPYDEYILDPTTDGDKQPVIRIWYPKGSWSPGSERPGGTLMFVYPYKSSPNDQNNPVSATSAALEYEVYIPSDFDFVKGGKLMGMSGGRGGGRGCGGGADPAWCFNSRIMWRRDGWGEAYLYVPEGMQHPEFCNKYQRCSGTGIKPCNFCNLDKGVSFARGGFVFQKGEWNKIYMNMTLNTPNVTNGILEIRHNGRRAIYFDKLNWRQTDEAKIEAVEFSTWFGGSNSGWGPPKDTHVLLRNIKIWRDDPPGTPYVVPSSPRPPVLIEEELHETPW